MARKKNPTVPIFVKIIFIGLLIIGLGFVVVDRTRYLFARVSYFNIRSVVIDPSLQFIQTHDLKNLIGKNIFTIDLRSVQRKLRQTYPQASQLKVVRRLPDQISIVAKQRVAFAQVQVNRQRVILDTEGVVLSVDGKGGEELPAIAGLHVENQGPVLGLPLKSADIWMALKIIKSFNDNKNLSSHSVKEIDIANFSKIMIRLSNGLDVIIDRDQIVQKIRVLGVVLAQDALNLGDVKYIDLRFKEPIIGKK